MLETVAMAQAAKNIILPAAVVGGVGVASYVGYKAAKAAWGWTEDIVDDIKGLVDDGKLEPILGKKTYTDNKTGKTYNNPLAGVPVLGSLFGSGINIGMATNPFD